LFRIACFLPAPSNRRALEAALDGSNFDFAALNDIPYYLLDD
jgi:hypothetical protein